MVFLAWKNFAAWRIIAGPRTYQELKHLFAVADQKYDSGLFEMLDEDRLVISDSVIIEIFQSLYYPNNSYEFGVVDPYIIGQIYELFLDESLEIQVDGQVVCVQKPEVVDAQGTVNHRREEAFMAAFFDSKCKFLGDSVIATGSISYAYVSPMELFRKALLRNAVMIVILHNHPSGDPTPSTEDKKLTEQIRAGASVLGLTLADHIVIGDQQYFSFRENKLL